MRYHVLATDYDGTLAHNSRVHGSIVQSLHSFLATGRRLVMVTGRELPELLQVFPHAELFEWIVAENGGLLYRPSTKEERPLAESPPVKLVEAPCSKGVHRISVGRVIVATWEPFETLVLETIRELGLELQVIFNKGAVMILPAGVNKASGLTAALKEMGISPHNTVGVGDAENDHAFLGLCEFSTAVANALPSVKEKADLVTERDHGTGVAELIEKIVRDDLASFNGDLARHYLTFGTEADEEFLIPSYGPNLLICGPSGSGKSHVATRIVESLMEQKYQFCLIDPEGDYQAFEGAMVLGGPKGIPRMEEILRALENPETNVIVCLSGMPIPDRPPLFLGLLAQLLQMRSKSGRPHWLIMDEAHHLMPAEWLPPVGLIPEQLHNTLLVTVHPNLLSRSILDRIDMVAAVGDSPEKSLQTFAGALETDLPAIEPTSLKPDEILLWTRDQESPLRKVQVHPGTLEHQRHHRKYSEGELPPERSFYFKGPEGKLNLRAQNLMLFLQIADGVDDPTWEFHRRQGDYSRWFRESIKDDDLGAVAQQIETQSDLSPHESRQRIREAVERDYTLAGASPLPVPGAG